MAKSPDFTTPEARLRWARQSAGFETAEDAAKRFNWKAVTYRSHETGERGYSRHVAMYSKAFKRSIEWLLTGKGDPDAFVDEETAELIGIVPYLSAHDKRDLLDLARIKAARAKRQMGDREEK